MKEQNLQARIRGGTGNAGTGLSGQDKMLHRSGTGLSGQDKGQRWLGTGFSGQEKRQHRPGRRLSGQDWRSTGQEHAAEARIRGSTGNGGTGPSGQDKKQDNRSFRPEQEAAHVMQEQDFQARIRGITCQEQDFHARIRGTTGQKQDFQSRTRGVLVRNRPQRPG
jgi:hypothetical protein